MQEQSKPLSYLWCSPARGIHRIRSSSAPLLPILRISFLPQIQASSFFRIMFAASLARINGAAQVLCWTKGSERASSMSPSTAPSTCLWRDYRDMDQ